MCCWCADRTWGIESVDQKQTKGVVMTGSCGGTIPEYIYIIWKEEEEEPRRYSSCISKNNGRIIVIV